MDKCFKENHHWTPKERLALLDNKKELFRHIAKGTSLLCEDESSELLQVQLQSEMERHLDAVEAIFAAHRLLRGNLPKKVRDRFLET